MLHDLMVRGKDLVNLAVIQDKRKRPSVRTRRAFANAVLERSFPRGALRSRWRGGRSRFRAAEPPHGVGADDRARRFGLLGLAVLALVLRADELSVNEDKVALVGGHPVVSRAEPTKQKTRRPERRGNTGALSPKKIGRKEGKCRNSTTSTRRKPDNESVRCEKSSNTRRAGGPR